MGSHGVGMGPHGVGMGRMGPHGDKPTAYRTPAVAVAVSSGQGPFPQTGVYAEAPSDYGWMPHNAGFGFLDLTPLILFLRQFWDYIS
jgi:hypothetical protein